MKREGGKGIKIPSKGQMETFKKETGSKRSVSALRNKLNGVYQRLRRQTVGDSK